MKACLLRTYMRRNVYSEHIPSVRRKDGLLRTLTPRTKVYSDRKPHMERMVYLEDVPRVRRPVYLDPA